MSERIDWAGSHACHIRIFDRFCKKKSVNAFLARCTKHHVDDYVTEYAMDYVNKCRRSYVSDQYSSRFEEQRLCLHCIQSRIPPPAILSPPHYL